ncbi:DUF3024 domain-containing protein [Rahnella sp. PAMC25617]|jgi:hypothetical protein|uniref:DUF3024 domain-containing protein n=1 Tax=Rahnella TaxID=34037 RepID=UPI000DEBFDA6|nr:MULTISPECIES: DUF3024 domain-containing protein [Rahnella]MDH2898036.1 DUF3024 domain-containing protein [Rahnella variigena]RBQ36082.1 hypothetical protein C2125_01275 [Rahnella aquatilis]
MAFTDSEAQRFQTEIQNFIETIRPPELMREKLDYLCHIKDQSIVIVSSRAPWRSGSTERIETPLVKMTYVRTQKLWRIFWMRATLKWETYAEVDTLNEGFEIVRMDEHSCFFG